MVLKNEEHVCVCVCVREREREREFAMKTQKFQYNSLLPQYKRLPKYYLDY